MRIAHVGFRAFALIGLAVPTAVVEAADPSARWTSRIDGPAASVFASHREAPALTADASGALFVHELIERRDREALIARIDALTGVTLWSSASETYLGSFFTHNSVKRFIAIGDGSSIVIAGAVTRFDADGSVVWARGTAIHPDNDRRTGSVAGDALFLIEPVGDTTTITHVDTTSGLTVDLLKLPYACGSKVAASSDAVGTFAVLNCAWNAIVQLRTAPLRVAWIAPVGARQLADAAGVYAVENVSNESVLRRLSTTDGSVEWTTTTPPITSIDLDPLGNIVASTRNDDPAVCTHQLRRHDSDDGSMLWSMSATGKLNDIDFADTTIVAVGDESCASSPPGAVGFAAVVDLGNGGLESRTPIASPRSGPITVNSVAVAGARVFAAGSSCLVEDIYDCQAVLWHADVGSTEFQGASIEVESATVGDPITGTDFSTWMVALEWTSSGQALRMRNVRNSDGAILSDRSVPARLPSAVWRYANEMTFHLTSDGDMAVLLADTTGYSAYTDAVVFKLDPVTGIRRWELPLFEFGNGQESVYARIEVDADSNVFVSTTETFFLPPPHDLARAIRKLDAATGAEIWRRTYNGLYFGHPSMLPLGNDLLTSTPAGYPGAGWARIRGTDGEVLWNNPSPPPANFIDIGETEAIFAAGGTSIEIASLDLVNGTMLTSMRYAEAGDSSFSLEGRNDFDGDDLYLGGTYYHQSDSTPRTRRGFLLRYDKIANAMTWINRGEENPAMPGSRFNPRGLVAGVIHGTQPIRLAHFAYGYALTSHSAQTGAVLGTQFLYARSGYPQFPDRSQIGILDFLDSGEPLIIGPVREPGSPMRHELSSFPAPAA